MSPSLSCDGLVTDLILYRSCKGDHGCLEFTNMVLLCLEDTVSSTPQLLALKICLPLPSVPKLWRKSV